MLSVWHIVVRKARGPSRHHAHAEKITPVSFTVRQQETRDLRTSAHVNNCANLKIGSVTCNDTNLEPVIEIIIAKS